MSGTSGNEEADAASGKRATTVKSRFAVDDIVDIDREQLSVRSLGELLDLQRQAEEQNDQATVRSLGEALADDQSGRERSGSGSDVRPRSQSAAESRLATAALPMKDIAKRVVLLAMDSSAHSRSAFHWYVDNLWKHGDLLLITHIYQQPYLPIFSLKSGLSLPHDVWQEKLQEGLKAAEKLVSSYETACLAQKINYQSVLRSGSPGEKICEAASEYKAQIIVMGCRGGGTLRRTILGSVATYTINHSCVPVTVVPDPQKS